MRGIWFILLFLVSFVCLYSIEKGKASYYHKKFEGRRTASGAIYKGDDFVCAHRKHPFGTELYVVNPLNKQRVKVTVIDRGPFIRGRVIDLSYAAAERIDLLGKGVMWVEIYPVIDSLEFLPLSDLIRVDLLETKKYIILDEQFCSVKRF